MTPTGVLLALCPWGAIGGALRERRGFLARLAPVPRAAGDGRQTCAELVNHGTFFTVDVEVGTPGQRFGVVADTGSDTLVVPSCICRETGFCTGEEHCFTGTNHSSTFSLLLRDRKPEGMTVTYGSGTIEGVVVQEVVQVGQIRALMKGGIMLMVKKVLNFNDPFEGILGLGTPKNLALQQERERQVGKKAGQQSGDLGGWKDILEGMITRDVTKKIEDIVHQPGNGTGSLADESVSGLGKRRHQLPFISPPGFLEQSNIKRFGICFNEGTNGVLRLGMPPLPGTLTHGSVGEAHWGLDFRGISVGRERPARVQICDAANLSRGQRTPCGAIPDSGTTLITGPKDQLALLLESVCDGWPRCMKNYTATAQAAKAVARTAAAEFGFSPFKLEPWSKGDAVSALLEDCHQWIDESLGLDELPPLHFHVAGSTGTQQALEMPGYAYVIETALQGVEREGTKRGSSSAAKSSMGSPKKVCLHAFSAMEYNTAVNGPVWILGSPFFYRFNVGYDLAMTPPGISFQSVEEVPCGSCDDRVGLVSEGADAGAARATASRRPRWVSGPVRGPSFDIGEPL